MEEIFIVLGVLSLLVMLILPDFLFFYEMIKESKNKPE